MNILTKKSNIQFFFRFAVSFVFISFIVSAAIPSVSAADGINRYVSPSGSDTGDCSSELAPCQTITYALSKSDELYQDTLLLDVGVYTENLVIDRNIRIVQDPAKVCPQSHSLNYVPCAIVDGDNAGRVINIAAGFLTVSLEKLTIRNGDVTDLSGAGIFNNGTLILDDVSIHDNSIHFSNPSGTNYPFSGGAIDNQNTLTIRSSTLYNNSAYDGGGIKSTGTLIVQNTEIYGNSAVRFGGGIWIPYGSPSTIENSTIWGNSAGSNGGGVCIYSDGTLGNRGEEHIFNNVTISGNSAVISGGGLYSYLKVTMDHSTLAENISPDSGADLFLIEYQTLPGADNPHSQVSNTIVSNQAATLPVCFITGYDTFDLSGGGNLSSDSSCDFTQTSDLENSNPLLMTLADNGGHVRTRALPFGSPAIDHAGPYLLGADARGVFPQDGDLNGSVIPDVGAFEFLPPYIYLPVIMR
jgi:hypothetical protein